MTTMTQINHADLAFFNRLATMTSNRHDALPPTGTFFSEQHHEDPRTVGERLETLIMDLHNKMCPTECIPERAAAFSFEYLPWADEDGEHDVILTTTIVGNLDYEVGLALISHIVTTGEPTAATHRLEAAGLEAWVEARQITTACLGILLGGLAVLITQIIVPML